MQNQLYTADGIGPLLIYLAIFAFWAIAKKISQLAMKQQDGSPKESTMDPDLKDFLEKLSGKKLQPQGPPVQPPPPVMPPVKVVPPPLFQAETRHLESGKIVSPPSYTPQPVAPPSEEGGDLIAQTEIGDEIHQETKLTLGKLSALTRMPSMRMAMPSHKLPFQKDDKKAIFRVGIRDRRSLTRAMVERIVLGPPRGQGDNSEDRHSGLQVQPL